MSWYSLNPYQSFWDWVMGRWVCPKCKKTWESINLFEDCTFVEEIGNKKIVYILCPDIKCNYKEILKTEKLKRKMAL